MRVALVAVCTCLATACGTSPASLVATATGRLHVRWAYATGDGTAIDCRTIGPYVRVDVRADTSLVTSQIAACADGEYTTDPFQLGTDVDATVFALDDSGRVVAANGDGYRTIDQTGVIETPPIVIELFVEPEPQMRALLADVISLWPSPVTASARFPQTMWPTPTLGSCCPVFCSASPEVWMVSPWTELGYAVTEKSRWSYDLDAQGAGLNATFQIHAFADLDCDGAYSHFELDGAVDPTGHVIAGPIERLVQGE